MMNPYQRRSPADNAPPADELETPTPPPADDDSSSSSTPDRGVPSVGDTVSLTTFDYREGAGGADVTRFGVVLDVVDNHADGSPRLNADNEPAPAAIVAWLPDVSDPVPVSELQW